MPSSFKPSPNVTSGDTRASGSSHQFTGSVGITGSLTVNGVSITGAGGGGGGSPGAPVNSVQFNEASSFGGDAQFTWNTTTQFLAITGTSDATPAVGISGAFYVGGGQGINPDPEVSSKLGTGSIGLGYYGYDSDNEEDVYAITLYGISGDDPFDPGVRLVPYIDIGTTDGNGIPGIPATDITIGSTGSNVNLLGGEDADTLISIGSSDARISLAGTSLTSSVDWEFDLSAGTGLITLAEMDTAAKGIRFVNGKSEDIGSDVFVIGKINSSSAGGIDIDLYTGSLKNVSTLTASSHVSASTFYGDGSNLTGISGGGSPGGSDTYIQFNNNGSFSGSSGLTTDGSGSLTTIGVTSSGGFNAGANITSADATLEISVLNTSAPEECEPCYSGIINLVMGDGGGDSNAVHFKTFGAEESVANISSDGDFTCDGSITPGGGVDASNGSVTAGAGINTDAITANAGDADLVITSAESYNLKLGYLDTATGITFFGKDDEDAVLGSILSSSAGGMDINLYTGSLAGVGDLTTRGNTILGNSSTDIHQVSGTLHVSGGIIQHQYFSASISSPVNATCSLYNVFNYHLTANSEVTASSPVAGTSYLFFFRQDSTGGRVVTFSGFKWPGGTAPTLSTASLAVDIVSGISDGTYIYADTTKEFR